MDADQLRNEAERRLWSSFARGEPVDLGEGEPTEDGFDPDTWGEPRTVRAEVITRLLLGAVSVDGGYAARVDLAGARIAGILDLNGGETTRELRLDRCWFDAAPDLADARTRGIWIFASHLPGLQADRLRTDGPLRLSGCRAAGGISLESAHIGGHLELVGAELVGAELPGEDGAALAAELLTVDGSLICSELTATGEIELSGANIGGQVVFDAATLTTEGGTAFGAIVATFKGSLVGIGLTAIGEVALSGAKIGGQLNLHGARLSNPDGAALAADGLTVDSDLVCAEEFSAAGELRLTGAHVSGYLNFDGAQLHNADGVALAADNLVVDNNLTCRDGFSAVGEVRLPGAHIGGQLNLRGAQLSNPNGAALTADRLVVDSDMMCDEGFSASGEVRLPSAHISGYLDLRGAQLHNPDGAALTADRLVADSSILCGDGFLASGEVALLGAHVGGFLDLGGAELRNAGGVALAADNLVVDNNLKGDGFSVDGEVRLLGARIGGQLNLRGARLSNPDGQALAADRMVIASDMFCDDGFSAVGEVRLLGARVGGELSLLGATLIAPDGLALDCEAVQTDELRLDAAVTGAVDLTRARLGVLHLPDLATQPQMLLNGLTYLELNPDTTVRQHAAWLRRDPDGYHPQPYEQLAAFYRGVGHDRDARVVLLKKHRAYRRQRPHHWPAPLRYLVAPLWRGPGLLLDALSGYGYVPIRAFCWLLAAVAAGWWGLRTAPLPTPTTSAEANTLLYVVDTLVPTSPFGLEGQATLHGAYLGWSLALQVLGYALSIAVLPSITRALGRGGT